MGQSALSVTSRTYGGCLERCGLGLAPGCGPIPSWSLCSAPPLPSGYSKPPNKRTSMQGNCGMTPLRTSAIAISGPIPGLLGRIGGAKSTRTIPVYGDCPRYSMGCTGPSWPQKPKFNS